MLKTVEKYFLKH